jgi:penicillin-insensitive murein DD-endopeptidase
MGSLKGMSSHHKIFLPIRLLAGTFCLTACLLLTACAALQPSKKEVSNPWAEVKKPLLLREQPEAFGFYTYGCLSGGVELPVSGPYWEVVNAKRNRYYAHPDSVDFLEKLGLWATPHGKLLLGDISQPAGGPTSYGHSSHQMGLDIDVRFGFAQGVLEPDSREGYPMVAVAKHFMEAKDGAFGLVNEITPDWNPVYGEALQASALHPRVDRIFVSPPIKRKVCQQFRRANGRGGFTYPEWLVKIRPYYEHNAHFHVRLKCPADSLGCQPQNPNLPDPTDVSLVGCAGTELGWWFESDHTKPGYLKEAADDHIKRGGVPAPLESLDWESKHKKLPAQCLELLEKQKAAL